MEGKTVIASFLIMSLVMVQIQLGAALVCCCPSMMARNAYNDCMKPGTVSRQDCASISGCTFYTGRSCHRPKDNLENSGDLVNEYCKLGCASSVCGAITSLQNLDKNEIVNGAVAQCTKACSTLCTSTKGSTTALETG